MPHQTIHLTDADRALLERVRVHQGLDSIEQAAEWLTKARIRRKAQQSNGRGRALYLVGKERAK